MSGARSLLERAVRSPLLVAVAAAVVATAYLFNPVLEGDTLLDVAPRQGETYPWAGVGDTRVGPTLPRTGTVLAGDWDCDGRDEPAVHSNGTFGLPSSPRGSAVRIVFGRRSDTPIAGDWDGDGCDEVGVWRAAAGAFILRIGVERGAVTFPIRFGDRRGVPVVGDWDGDGDDEVGTRTGGKWELRSTLARGPADLLFGYGDPDTDAVVGDWDANGTTDIGIRDENVFHLRASTSTGPPTTILRFGRTDDVLLPGDWDGDGRDDVGLRRGSRLLVRELVAGGSPVLHYDQADSFYPWQVFINRTLRDGDLPLWNPYSFGGTPFLSNGQNGVFYPPRFALSLVASPARVHDALVLTHVVAAALVMWLLLLYAGAGQAGAIVGGLAWALNSFMLAWVALEHITAVAVWLPLAVLLVDVAVRRRSWAAAIGLGGVLALLYLGGNALFVEACFVVVGVYGAALLARQLWSGRRGDWRTRAVDGARFATPWLVAAGLGAVAILPNLQLVSESARDPLTYAELLQFELPRDKLRHFFEPPSPFEIDLYHANLFLGTPLALAVLVGALRRRSRLATFARVLAVAALLFAVGTVVTRIGYETLPGFDNFKPLGRILFLFQFAAAILVAFGIQAVIRLAGSHGHRVGGGRALPWLLVAGAAVISFGQLADFADRVVRHQPDERALLYPETELTHFLERQPDPLILPTGSSFRGSTTMVFGLRSGGGYESLLPDRTTNLWRTVEGFDPRQVAAAPLPTAYHPGFDLPNLRYDRLARAGVTHLVTVPAAEPDPPSQARKWGARLERVYAGSDGDVYAVPGALPRAYVVSRCVLARGPRDALVRFMARGFNFRRSVVLEQADARREGVRCADSAVEDAGSARILERELNSLRIEVDARRDAFLVVPESWEAGWRARVDGDEAPVLPANSALRAVPVRAGRHQVELRFEPAGYERGRAASALTLAVVGGLGLFALRRRVRRRRRPRTR
jgi:hypothetical protein